MTTSYETQNITILRRVAKPSLFCAIAVAFSMVALADAAGQGRNGVAVIGPNPSSTPYGCTTAGTSGNIQQAILDAVNHTNGITQSVVDASNCTTLSITSPIFVGARPGNTNQRIKFIVPANGTWTTASPWTDPNNYGYAFLWGNGAMIYGGTGSGEGQPFTIVHSSASRVTLTAVCGNDPDIADMQKYAATYYHAEGFTCANGSKVNDAVMEINFSQDESYVGHANVLAYSGSTIQTGRLLWIHAACCSATFEDINADAGNIASTTPCVFGDLNAAIHVSKLSCVHPGSGKNAIQIFQSGSAVNNGVGSTYKDIYVEEGASGDTGTPYVQVQPNAGTWAAADLLDGLRADQDATHSTTRCMVDIAVGSRVNISNLSLGSSSTCAVNDHVNGLTINAAVPNSVIASYDMTPRYDLTPGTLTVNSLPSAASNAGKMFAVSDSTPVNQEGQACQGNGSTTALAFSNGSVWKCF